MLRSSRPRCGKSSREAAECAQRVDSRRALHGPERAAVRLVERADDGRAVSRRARLCSRPGARRAVGSAHARGARPRCVGVHVGRRSPSLVPADQPLTRAAARLLDVAHRVVGGAGPGLAWADCRSASSTSRARSSVNSRRATSSLVALCSLAGSLPSTEDLVLFTTLPDAMLAGEQALRRASDGAALPQARARRRHHRLGGRDLREQALHPRRAQRGERSGRCDAPREAGASTRGVTGARAGSRFQRPRRVA